MSSKKRIKERKNGFQTLNIDLLDPSPYQARESYPEGNLRELADSIRSHGVIEPIIVRKDQGRYEVCAGWGRVLASRMSGAKKIPAIVRDLSEEDMVKLGLVENLKRVDLTIVGKANGMRTLQKKFHMTHAQIASVLSLTPDVVSQTIRILGFPESLQDLLSHDKISPTHAEALNRLAEDPTLLNQAIRNVIDRRLTTVQTEQTIQDLLEQRKLRKDILDYVTSEDFISTLCDMLPNPPAPKVCPLCGYAELYDDAQERLACKRCGWTEEASKKLSDLCHRIREYKLKKLGLRPYWETEEFKMKHKLS
jgi:ParB family chromosome partitioning protein